jgi:hypothetical protein
MGASQAHREGAGLGRDQQALYGARVCDSQSIGRLLRCGCGESMSPTAHLSLTQVHGIGCGSSALARKTNQANRLTTPSRPASSRHRSSRSTRRRRRSPRSSAPKRLTPYVRFSMPSCLGKRSQLRAWRRQLPQGASGLVAIPHAGRFNPQRRPQTDSCERLSRPTARGFGSTLVLGACFRLGGAGSIPPLGRANWLAAEAIDPVHSRWRRELLSP